MTPQLAGLSEQGGSKTSLELLLRLGYILEPDLSFQVTLAAKTTKRFERQQHSLNTGHGWRRGT